jgi:hypothetical protein
MTDPYMRSVAFLCTMSLNSIGMKMGGAISLACFLVLRIISDVGSTNPDRVVDRRATAFYRCVAMFLLLGWLWGCAIWVWTKWRINYVYIFRIDRYRKKRDTFVWLCFTDITFDTFILRVSVGGWVGVCVCAEVGRISRTRMNHTDVFDEMSTYTMVYLVNFLLFYLHFSASTHAHGW